MNIPILATRYDAVNQFANQLIPLILNERARQKNNGNQSQYILPSVVLAQAGLESGWNINASTLFGIKGDGVELDTTEYINGEYINLKDSFACYGSLAEAIQGYYELMNWEHYTPVCYALGYKAQTEQLSICGYATDPNYSFKLLSIIECFDLAQFDNLEEEEQPAEEETNEEPVEDTPNEPISTCFELGVRVIPLTDENSNITDINGVVCHAWYNDYEVIESNDNDSVLAINGVVFGRFENNKLEELI